MTANDKNKTGCTKPPEPPEPSKPPEGSQTPTPNPQRRQRAQDGVKKAREKGTRLGRPTKDLDHKELWCLLKAGYSIGSIASYLGVSRGTVVNRIKELGYDK